MITPLITDFLVNGEPRHVTFDYRSIAALITQEQSVSEEEHAARMIACRGCDSFRPENDLCATCGFNAPIRAAWDRARCPEGRW